MTVFQYLLWKIVDGSKDESDFAEGVGAITEKEGECIRNLYSDIFLGNITVGALEEVLRGSGNLADIDKVV